MEARQNDEGRTLLSRELLVQNNTGPFHPLRINVQKTTILKQHKEGGKKKLPVALSNEGEKELNALICKEFDGSTIT